MDLRPKRPHRSSAFAGSAYRQYRAGLQRFLMRRLHDAQNVQDLSQEAYLRLLRVEDAELVRKPQAYLYRIASNLVYEFKLRERQDPVTFDSEAVERIAEKTADDRPTDELGERLSTERQLEKVLDQLPPLYRSVFILRKRDGLSLAEIAQQLGISVHTVKKYLFRAVMQCRAADWDR